MPKKAVCAALPCSDCGKPRGRERSRGRCRPCQVEFVRAADRARLNPARNREKARAHYWANRDRVLARMATPEGRAYARERQRAKMATAEGRLYSNVGRGIRTALKAAKAGRKWETVVGYTLADLTAHLERQFDRRMTWANMGEWEVDHIRPRCSFDLSDPAQFLECWALTNLRPLWSVENRAKSGNRLHLL
jgi:hypothetical protein